MMRDSTTLFSVKNVKESLAYYRDKIGFDVAFEYGTPTYYVGLCSGDVSLHLIDATQAPRPPGNGVVSVFVDDVDSLYAGMLVRGARVIQQIRDQEYGLRNFATADLDGNMIIFGMEIRKAA